jgi:hypothetical protein
VSGGTTRLRTPAIVVVLLGIVALVLAGASRPDPLVPVFTSLGAPTTPFVPQLDFVTSSWFCPGVPVGGAGLGGSVVVANPGDTPLSGQVTAFTDGGAAPVVQPLQVAPRDTATVDVGALQRGGTYVAALVEISGGGGYVEQRAVDPLGAAVAPCSNATSNSWSFADGYTKDASTEDIVITNPFPDVAIVNFDLATAEGNRSPSTLQGFPVPGRSVTVVKLDAIVRDDASVAVGVASTRGRVVVGRAQRYAGSGRAGFTMNLGAPSLTDQAFFADGESGQGIAERYSVYNGSDSDITVQAVFLGVPIDAAFPNDQQISVPAGGVATLNTADVTGLPAGRHGVVFSTTSASAMVVERALTRPAGDGIATSVVLGQPARAAVRRWSLAISSELAVDDTLVVLNVDNQDALITVKVLGLGGEVPVAGMENVAVGKNQTIALTVTDPTALGRPWVVESSSRIYVERMLPRGGALRGRSGSFALPN